MRGDRISKGADRQLFSSKGYSSVTFNLRHYGHYAYATLVPETGITVSDVERLSERV